MRLLSLAVVAALFAVGFGYAQEKKPADGAKKPAEGEKKADKKPGKVVGLLSKIDGDKLTVTVKGDGGEKSEVFTTTDKTKFFKEEAAPAKDGEKKEGDKPVEKKPADKKPEVVAKDGEKKPADKPADKPAEKKPAPKRTEIKLSDLKTGSRVAVMSGEDKVAVEVVVLPTPAKKEGK